MISNRFYKSISYLDMINISYLISKLSEIRKKKSLYRKSVLSMNFFINFIE